MTSGFVLLNEKRMMLCLVKSRALGASRDICHTFFMDFVSSVLGAGVLAWNHTHTVA